MKTATHESSLTRLGGLMLAIGSIGVVLTSLFYALSPVSAALPIPAIIYADVLKDMLAGRATMIAAGTVGVPGDIIMMGGMLLLMVFRQPASWHAERLGWAFLVISVLVFTFVDALAVGVLTQLAALDGALGAFAGFKLLFNILFVTGVIAFGFGVPLILWGEMHAAVPVLPRALCIIGIVVGLIGIAAGALFFVGVSLPLVCGLVIASGSAIFAIYGFRIMRSAQR